MPPYLLSLSDGHLSLEFHQRETGFVRGAIYECFGNPEIFPHILSSGVRFGGCRFTHNFEGEDQCLISDTAEGDGILRHLCEYLNRPEACDPAQDA